jgi:hypothetical protein
MDLEMMEGGAAIEFAKHHLRQLRVNAAGYCWRIPEQARKLG